VTYKDIVGDNTQRKIVHINKNIAIVPISEIKICGRLDAKHYISKEHEQLCKLNRLKKVNY
jgi:hypothetical protein